MRLNVLLLSLCQALFMTGSSMVITVTALAGVILTPVPGLATFPLSLQFVATMATTVPASFIMRRFGRRAGFVFGSLVGGMGGLLSAYAMIHNAFVLLCIGAALIGVLAGFAIYYRFAAADCADEANRPRAISLVLAGGVIAAFSGPNLATLTADWFAEGRFAGTYLALVALQVAVIAALAFVRIPRLTAAERKESGRPLAAIARQPAAMVAVLSAVVGYSAMNLVMTATPLAVMGHHYLFADAAFVIQWHVFAMFAPAFVTGSIIRRIGVLPVISAGAVLIVTCIAINLSGTGLVHFTVALMALGVGWNFMFVGGTTLLTTVVERSEQAKVQGVNDLLVFASVAAASLGSGALHQSLGWGAVNVAALPGVALALTAALWLWSLRLPRRA